ncbi:hypothetical protein CSC17_1172 [Klebsiella oxytoca]|nr:hypothetical protein CSC17_1172 [Klebsiella oxytoca]
MGFGMSGGGINVIKVDPINIQKVSLFRNQNASYHNAQPSGF